MSCNSYNTNPTFKECAGKNCNNKATIKLKLKIIKKDGFFCKSCAMELNALDLIEKDELGDDTIHDLI